MDSRTELAVWILLKPFQNGEPRRMAKKTSLPRNSEKNKTQAIGPAERLKGLPVDQKLTELSKRRTRLGPPPKINIVMQANGSFNFNLPENDAENTFALFKASGSMSEYAGQLTSQLACLALNLHSKPEKATRTANALLSALHGIEPRNEMESMLASQMVATQALAMEMLTRAAHAKSADAVGRLVNASTKLMRTYTAQFDALLRSRGKKTEQRVVVEHVHVEAGGQAVVGAVQTGGVGSDGKK
jgi:hypothetical protein